MEAAAATKTCCRTTFLDDDCATVASAVASGPGTPTSSASRSFAISVHVILSAVRLYRGLLNTKDHDLVILIDDRPDGEPRPLPAGAPWRDRFRPLESLSAYAAAFRYSLTPTPKIDGYGRSCPPVTHGTTSVAAACGLALLPNPEASAGRCAPRNYLCRRCVLRTCRISGDQRTVRT